MAPEGNVLRKGRKNYYLSNDCNRYVEEIGAREGLNESAVIEVAVRRLYEVVFGPRPSSPPKNVIPWGEQERRLDPAYVPKGGS